MKKVLITLTAVMTVLMLTAGTASAQDKKQVEKKIKIVTVDEKGVKTDTTIISSDTLEFEGENLIINTREGKRIIQRPGRESRMIYIDTDKDVLMGPEPFVMRMRPGAGGVGPAWFMDPAGEEKEGVIYRLSVDGVVVNIRAPKEKAAQADQILREVQKILMKK